MVAIARGSWANIVVARHTDLESTYDVNGYEIVSVTFRAAVGAREWLRDIRDFDAVESVFCVIYLSFSMLVLHVDRRLCLLS